MPLSIRMDSGVAVLCINETYTSKCNSLSLKKERLNLQTQHRSAMEFHLWNYILRTGEVPTMQWFYPVMLSLCKNVYH